MGALLDHPIVTERYFFPRRAPLAAPLLVEVAGGAARLACHHRPAPPGRPTLLFFHGNGEIVADYQQDWVHAIGALGVGVFLAEYRGYGGSTGTPALAAMLDDVPEFVRALGVPPERLVAYGRSVGSLYAIECAARFSALGGLVIESGIADVLERLRLRLRADELGATEAELEAAVRARFDHRAKLGAYRGRLLVMHTRDDELVGFDHAERNLAWAGTSDKRLVAFERGGHNALLVHNWLRYLDELEAFLG